jgi:hypothetical protein
VGRFCGWFKVLSSFSPPLAFRAGGLHLYDTVFSPAHTGISARGKFANDLAGAEGGGNENGLTHPWSPRSSDMNNSLAPPGAGTRWCSASATSAVRLQFKSSYTVVEHAPEESIELEIERHALEQIEKLQAAAREGDFTELFRLLGTSEAQRAIDADGGPGPEYTSVENTKVEAVQARRPPATR